MKTNQPSYFCLANLGDATPFEHGGDFILVDRRGIYEPQLWHFEASETEGKPGEWYRFDIPQCFLCHENTDNLGSNRFHPHSAEWFGYADKIQSIADSSGLTAHELREMLCASDPVERAMGYISVAGYYGFHEFDEDAEEPGVKFDRAMCRLFLRQIAQSATWKAGIGI